MDSVTSHVVANTKLYLPTLVTLHAMFPAVDIYPAWNERNETQAIAVAVSAPRPATESLMQRALAQQKEYRFRYPLPALVGNRVTELYSKGADWLNIGKNDQCIDALGGGRGKGGVELLGLGRLNYRQSHA